MQIELATCMERYCLHDLEEISLFLTEFMMN